VTDRKASEDRSGSVIVGWDTQLTRQPPSARVPPVRPEPGKAGRGARRDGMITGVQRSDDCALAGEAKPVSHCLGGLGGGERVPSTDNAAALASPAATSASRLLPRCRRAARRRSSARPPGRRPSKPGPRRSRPPPPQRDRVDDVRRGDQLGDVGAELGGVPPQLSIYVWASRLIACLS
jgi:hypothetical protein